ncbi:MAG: hypothetical protein HRT94_09695 [Alphaproteobacteria bacterium]|nr:hypothetical protein [Alphaproteobacteria bacterium]
MLLLSPKDKAVGYTGNGDYDLIDGEVFWKDHATEEASHVYTGIALASTKAALKIAIAFARAGKTKNEKGQVDSDVAHNVMSSLADPETRIMPKFGAVVSDVPFYDVASIDMKDRAEAALQPILQA